MKPPVPYFGSKARIATRIVDLLPDHGHYVEPYCGSLAVLLAKAPSRMETVNDLDGELVTFWRVLRDRPEELIRACALTPHSRAEHALAYGPTDNDLELARRIWVRLAQGRAGHTRKTGWRHHINPDRDGGLVPSNLAAFVDRMGGAADRLTSVSLECRPALEVIAAYGTYPGTLLYVDPPYLGSTRPNGDYRYDMASVDEHRELAGALGACRSAVVLSGYDSALYAELYAGWHRYELATMTGNARAAKGRTEVLWSNRPLGVGLFAEGAAS